MTMFKTTQVIFGAPGCGKTTEIMNIMKDLLTTYAPEEVALVTFTKAGAAEAQNRLTEAFPQYNKKRFEYVRTIHSLCYRLLNIGHGSLISRKDYKEFSKAVNKRFLGYYTEELKNNDDKYLFLQSLELNNKKTFDKMIEEDGFINVRDYEYIKRAFDQYRYDMSVTTFDDMLTRCLREAKECPVKVAIIDEAQDLTSLQWDVCEMLFRNAEKVYIAGDDDQAIYEWMGADVERFLSYKKKDNVKILDQSYRLKNNILQVSKLLSCHITKRVKKTFAPVSEGGKVTFLNNIQDIPTIDPRETSYFLARNNVFLKHYEELIKAQGLYFVNKKDSPSINARYIECVIEYSTLSKGGASMDEIKMSSGTMSNICKDEFNPRDPWYDAFNLSVDEITYLRDIVRRKPESTTAGNIKISTIHGVKGGEADNVYIMLDVTRTVYENLQKMPDSELRCFYVGLTRAKNNLYIIRSNTRYGFDIGMEE